MARKVITKACDKCRGDLGRTGEAFRRGGKVLVEYQCLQCGKLTDREEPIERSDYRTYNG